MRRVSLTALFLAIIGIAFAAQTQETSTTQARPADGTPIYVLLAYRPEKTQHLLDMDDDLVAVQIASFTDQEQARLFVKFHSKLELIGARLIYGDETHYAIFLGIYEDDDSARWALDSFAEENPLFSPKDFKRIRLGELKPHILQ